MVTISAGGVGPNGGLGEGVTGQVFVAIAHEVTAAVDDQYCAGQVEASHFRPLHAQPSVFFASPMFVLDPGVLLEPELDVVLGVYADE